MTNVTTRSPWNAVTASYIEEASALHSAADACFDAGDDATGERMRHLARQREAITEFLSYTENVEAEIYAVSKLYAAWLSGASPIVDKTPEPTKHDGFIMSQAAMFRNRFPNFKGCSSKKFMEIMATLYAQAHSVEDCEEDE